MSLGSNKADTSRTAFRAGGPTEGFQVTEANQPGVFRTLTRPHPAGPGTLLSEIFIENEGLRQGRDTLLEGFGNLSSLVSQSPTERLREVQAGDNTFYNLQEELSRRAFEDNLSTVTADAARRGLEDSSVLGARQGELIGQERLNYLAGLNNAVTQQQALGESAFNTTANSAMNLLSLLQSLNTDNRNTLMNIKGQQEAAGTGTAARPQQSSFGSTLGGVLGTIGGIAAAPFTGGSSLAAIPSLSQIGSGIGNVFSGNQPAASPTSPTGNFALGAFNNFSNQPSFSPFLNSGVGV